MDSHMENLPFRRKKSLQLSHESWGPTGPTPCIFLSNEFSQIVP